MARHESTVHFVRGPHRFDVRRERRNGDAAFVGYFDGRKSITAPQAEVAVRTLLKKHVDRCPAATVISFARARNRVLRS